MSPEIPCGDPGGQFYDLSDLPPVHAMYMRLHILDPWDEYLDLRLMSGLDDGRYGFPFNRA